MPATTSDEPIAVAPDDAVAIRQFNDAIRPAQTDERRALLVGPSGEALPIPAPIYEALRQAAALMAQGRAVALIPIDQEFSTQQAANHLNMSRPHLIKLLENGEIPFTKVGRHRRVRFGDLQEFRRKRDRRRTELLSDLTRLAQETGGYE
jgi:excisionase family DNA binding protein